MDLNSNGARAIAALIVVNAGLFVSHHSFTFCSPTRSVRAEVMAARGEACKARAEAHVAALEARVQARAAAREMVKARIQLSQEAHHAAAMAPTAARTHTTIHDYVQCLLNSGVRSVVSGS